MNCCIPAALGSLVSLTPGPLAHAGHGHDGGNSGLVHYLTEPTHAIVAVVSLAVVSVMAGLTIRVVRKRRDTRRAVRVK
jgi:hypothetical protein